LTTALHGSYGRPRCRREGPGCIRSDRSPASCRGSSSNRNASSNSHSSEGFQRLAESQRLSQELQEILRNNDLRAAMEVLREETGGDNVIFFVLMKFVL
jgi:hypothetical protein